MTGKKKEDEKPETQKEAKENNGIILSTPIRPHKNRQKPKKFITNRQNREN